MNLIFIVILAIPWTVGVAHKIAKHFHHEHRAHHEAPAREASSAGKTYANLVAKEGK